MPDTYLTIPHMTIIVFAPVSSPLTEKIIIKTALLPRLYADSPLAPRYSPHVLRQTREAPRVLALPACVAAHARALAASWRVLPLPKSDAGALGRRQRLDRARLNRRRRRPLPSRTPALGELVLKVDSKFKVCEPSPFLFYFARWYAYVFF